MSIEFIQDPDFDYCLQWLVYEREYTLDKFGKDQDQRHVKEFHELRTESSADNWWDQQLENYYHRFQVLGLDTPNGRQALAKFVSTALGMLTAAVQVYGPLPEPGVSSGENLDKLKPLE